LGEVGNALISQKKTPSISSMAAAALASPDLSTPRGGEEKTVESAIMRIAVLR
jgi:hypothetical protein